MWERTQILFLAALERVTHTAAELLPSVFAMSIIIVITVPLAFFARLVVRRICTRVDLDHKLREWGMTQPAASGQTPPSQLIAKVISTTVLVLGLLLGLSALDTTATNILAVKLIDYVPHLLLGFLILGAGLAASRAAERRVLIGAVNMGLQSARMLGLGVRWLVVILASAMALQQIGLGGSILSTLFTLLFGGIVLALALAVGLGAKDVVARSLEKRVGAGDNSTAEQKDTASQDNLHHL